MQTARKPEHATTTNPTRQLATDLSQLVQHCYALGKSMKNVGCYDEAMDDATQERNILLGFTGRLGDPGPREPGVIEAASNLTEGIAAYLVTVLGEDDALRLEYDLKARLRDIELLLCDPAGHVGEDVSSGARAVWSLDWCERLQEIDQFRETLQRVPVTRPQTKSVEPNPPPQRVPRPRDRVRWNKLICCAKLGCGITRASSMP